VVLVLPLVSIVPTGYGHVFCSGTHQDAFGITGADNGDIRVDDLDVLGIGADFDPVSGTDIFKTG